MDGCDSRPDLRPILPIVPFHGRCLVFGGNFDVFMPSETLVVRRKDDMVSARFFDTDAIVGKRVGRMEVEDEQQPCTLKDDNLVGLVLEGYVSLRSGKPSVFLFSIVHRCVELVEVFVAKELVVSNVPLSSRVVERIVVSRPREVKPLQL